MPALSALQPGHRLGRWAFKHWLFTAGYVETGHEQDAAATAITAAHERAWDVFVAKADARALSAARRAYNRALRAAGVEPKDAPPFEPTRYGIVR